MSKFSLKILFILHDVRKRVTTSFTYNLICDGRGGLSRATEVCEALISESRDYTILV